MNEMCVNNGCARITFGQCVQVLVPSVDLQVGSMNKNRNTYVVTYQKCFTQHNSNENFAE